MKNKIKWCLDLVMVLLFVLMFNKRVISMSFHEIGGICLFAFICIHVGINYRYVINVTKRIFNKAMPTKARIGYVVNVGLLISFVLIGISGVFMSKVVFHIDGGNSWRVVHYMASAVSLVLIGVHVGLHWGFIKGIFKKFISIPEKVARPMAYVAMSAILVFGGMSLVTSSFSRWISMPFQASQRENRGPGNKQFSSEKGNRGNGGNKQFDRNNKDKFYGDSSMQKGQRPGGDGKMHGEMSQGFNFVTLLSVVTSFLSIVGVFAILTYWVEKAWILRKRKKGILRLEKQD